MTRPVRSPHWRSCLVVGVCLALASCDRAATQDGPNPPTSPAERVSPTPEAPSSGFVGFWQGSPCDQRTYVRYLELADDGTFSATDRVAPCPENVQCIWSGIVDRSGVWRLDRGMIVLELADGEASNMAEPLPHRLRWEQAQNALIEVVVGGPMTCTYRRVEDRAGI